MIPFSQLQQRLGDAWKVNSPSSSTDHVIVAMPSFSLGESTLAHYASRIPALEHRYLNAIFLLNTLPSCEFVFLSTVAPDPEVLEYYFSLFPSDRIDDAKRRMKVFVVPDSSPRPLAQKLKDFPEIISDLRQHFGGRPVFIEPWNVTPHEVAIAELLQAPINGTAPALWPLGFKSSGRKLFAKVGVPTPAGREDVRTPSDVVSAIRAIQSARPGCKGVVIKHDNSGAGDGNVVLRFDASDDSDGALRARVESLPAWYLADLLAGGVVEELVSGELFSSPSAQLDVTPFGEVRMLATHEQVLGGADSQVYMGCRFPADPSYAPQLAEYAIAIGKELAELGVVGRFSVDFVAAKDGASGWRIYALEMNLRKGGTTHPYATLRHLVPGTYDAAAGKWVCKDGTTRAYCSTDNMVDEAWQKLNPVSVIRQFREAGLQFDPVKGRGVALHMLSCLAIDGRFGLTAIGNSPADARSMFDSAADIVNSASELNKSN
jgi:hypothetical protein